MRLGLTSSSRKLHCNFPVEKMPLVEIIVGKKTSPETLARAMDFVQEDPQDADRGERQPRLLYQPRVRRLRQRRPSHAEGGHSRHAMIENCARYAGMPVGPLSLNDEVAIDPVVEDRRPDQARRPRTAGQEVQMTSGTEDILELMVKKLERFGLELWQGLQPTIRLRQQGAPVAGSCRSISRPIQKLLYGEREEPAAPRRARSKKRLLYVQSVDTALPRGQCADRPAGRRRRLDHGSRLRAARTEWRDQPDRQRVGIKKFVAECDDLAKYGKGKQFKVPKLLRCLAAIRKCFYGETGGKAA